MASTRQGQARLGLQRSSSEALKNPWTERQLAVDLALRATQRDGPGENSWMLGVFDNGQPLEISPHSADKLAVSATCAGRVAVSCVHYLSTSKLVDNLSHDQSLHPNEGGMAGLAGVNGAEWFAHADVLSGHAGPLHWWGTASTLLLSCRPSNV